jgi:hypothetical protein
MVGAIDLDRPYSRIFASATGGSGLPRPSAAKMGERSHLAKINGKIDN